MSVLSLVQQMPFLQFPWGNSRGGGGGGGGGTPTSFISTTDSGTTTIIFISLVGVLIVIFLIIGIRNGVSGGQKAGSFSLRKQCRLYGLESMHFKIIKKAIKDQKITSPASLFTNGRMLTAILRKVITEVEQSEYSENDKERLKAEIFEIKQRIATHIPGADKALSTKAIPINIDVTIFSKTFPPFLSKTSGKSGDALMLDLPRDSHGEWVSYPVGSPIKVRYIKDDGKVFAFTSNVIDIREIDGHMRLLLKHTDQVKRIQLRKSPRKEIHRTCFFYRVEIITEGKGRGATRKAAVDKNRRLTGNIEDLSSGGCAIFSRTPLQKGSLIMISFDMTKGNSISVFGKVRITQRDKSGTVMRIAFTKVSIKNLNAIRAYVFDFVESEKSKNQYIN